MAKSSLPKKQKEKVNFFFQSKIHKITTVCIALLLGISAATLSYAKVLYTVDEVLTNIIYSNNPFTVASPKITLVTIDNATYDRYGSNLDWSRQMYADAIQKLSEEGAAVIGLDVDLSSDYTADGDAALVEACANAGNVVMPVQTFFFETLFSDSKQEQTAASSSGDKMHIEESLQNARDKDIFVAPTPVDSDVKWSDVSVSSLKYPYEELAEVVTLGATNAVQVSPDGFIHNAAMSVNIGEKQMDSFAVSIYRQFAEFAHIAFQLPSLNSDELFGFNSVLRENTYQRISFCDLLSGDYDPSLIDEHIILIGEYDSLESDGLFEYFESRKTYQEVMLQAFILQALLEQRTVLDVPDLFQALFYGITITLFYIIFANRKRLFAFLGQLLWGFFIMAVAFSLNIIGYRFLLLIPIVFAIISTLIFLLQYNILNYLERKRMETTLKMYVDSKVVDEISEVSPFALAKYSERRQIAVLFVDIRGFTTMSEQLDPEQVVHILNEYFTLVYASIQAWNGTLDKFIGDAAMAIFNAPQEEDNFILHAVCAAHDIQQGFQELTQRYQNLYGKEIRVGIGINCGEAIVGNIGCLHRMDYTAIGDTVNTASRLESNAPAGEILISQSVLDATSDRVTAVPVGELSLKGKSVAVVAYSVQDIDKPPIPNPSSRKEFLNEVRLLYSKVESNFTLPAFLKRV
ncbi:MAG: adenylate/guanylate cyclase domain-containing protein [Lachnospiraceae bacterium]|nr:adenylate/guanylate cyclase domain-containing protein [Lachnospiraceae bacterium]